jgi:hypothetical protein
MKWLSFLSKLSFICNLCFIFCLLLRYSNLDLNEELNSLLIILGWVMAIVINAFYFLVTLIALARKRYGRDAVPTWLILANLLFLLIEMVYLILNPDML